MIRTAAPVWVALVTSSSDRCSRLRSAPPPGVECSAVDGAAAASSGSVCTGFSVSGAAVINSSSTCPSCSARSVASGPATPSTGAAPRAEHIGDALPVVLGVPLTQRLQGLADDLVLAGVAVEAQHVDDLRGQRRRQLVAQPGDQAGVASDDHPLDALVADDAIEPLDHLLEVLELQVLGVALIARLRPPAHRMAAGLLAGHVVARLDRAQAEDDDPGMIGVEQQRGVARVLVDEASQRIQVRHRADEQLVAVDRGIERDHGEELVVVDGGEDRRGVGRRVEARERGLHLLEGPRQAGLRLRVCLGRLEPLGLQPAQEYVVGVAPVLVGPEVEIEADHRRLARLEGRQPVEHAGQRCVDGG